MYLFKVKPTFLFPVESSEWWYFYFCFTLGVLPSSWFECRFLFIYLSHNSMPLLCQMLKCMCFPPSISYSNSDLDLQITSYYRMLGFQTFFSCLEPHCANSILSFLKAGFFFFMLLNSVDIRWPDNKDVFWILPGAVGRHWKVTFSWMIWGLFEICINLSKTVLWDCQIKMSSS